MFFSNLHALDYMMVNQIGIHIQLSNISKTIQGSTWLNNCFVLFTQATQLRTIICNIKKPMILFKW